MIARRLAPVLGGLALLAHAGAAVAQTAEEAVAYAFLGLADGATFERATTTMSWKEASASPAVFNGALDINGNAMEATLTVTAVDPCHYEVTLEGPMVPGGGRALYAKVDLTAVTDVAPAPGGIMVEVKGDGFCETGRTNPTCMTMSRSDLFGFLDADRHAETVAFIRTGVCPANAD